MKLIKTICEERGLCCNSCQESLDIHNCNKCYKKFDYKDIIYCEHHSQSDCMHYHEDCKPEED